MKKTHFHIILFYFLLGIVYIGHAQNLNKDQIYLEQMMICGSSNISDFKLTFLNQKIESTYFVSDISKDSLAVFIIPIKSITAINKFMLSDFRNFINADDFPFIRLSINKCQMDSITTGNYNEAIRVNVNIAGETNFYIIPFNKGCLSKSNNFITGNTNIYLSDFKLDPFKKFFGLIQLDDKVFINFKINFDKS